uniref:Uncharacterized protein n=1 Tax=Zooxanthella nutricula TaxID=1333877 RepID=A0A7S2KYE0_9DINO
MLRSAESHHEALEASEESHHGAPEASADVTATDARPIRSLDSPSQASADREDRDKEMFLLAATVAQAVANHDRRPNFPDLPHAISAEGREMSNTLDSPRARSTSKTRFAIGAATAAALIGAACCAWAAAPVAVPKLEAMLPHAQPPPAGDNTALRGHPHAHDAKCKGGPLVVCQCLLKCSIFADRSDMCSSEHGESDKTRSLVHALMAETIERQEDACEGMACIMRCARDLRCADERVRNSCRIVRSLQMDHQATCDLACDE